MLSLRKIAFVVNGNKTIGMGHVYRALTIADSLLGNPIRFFTYDSDETGKRLIEGAGYRLVETKNQASLVESLAAYAPDIVIDDILDTTKEYVAKIRALGAFVVNFEDLGEGNEEAHLVFNALYEVSSPPANHRVGPAYFCLNRNFMLYPPAEFRERADTLVATFGGVDENNLALRTCMLVPKLVEDLGLKKVLVVLGPGYSHKDELTAFLNTLEASVKEYIEVHERVGNMALLLRRADIAMTSNGRTVYELAALGIPTVSIAQNDRETLHLFARYSKGIDYLGIATNVSEPRLWESLKGIVQDKSLRLKMREALLSCNLRDGLDRVRGEILTESWRWAHADHEAWQ
jgi:spore coat polysaccharide biosynthesis predicted glycosyltransferase SpsG